MQSPTHDSPFPGVWMCLMAISFVLLLFAHKCQHAWVPVVWQCQTWKLADNSVASALCFGCCKRCDAVWAATPYSQVSVKCVMRLAVNIILFCVQVDAINYHVFANVWGREWPLAWSGSTLPCETHMLHTQFEVRPCGRAAQHMLLWLDLTNGKCVMLYIACAALHPCTDFRA